MSKKINQNRKMHYIAIAISLAIFIAIGIMPAMAVVSSVTVWNGTAWANSTTIDPYPFVQEVRVNVTAAQGDNVSIALEYPPPGSGNYKFWDGVEVPWDTVSPQGWIEFRIAGSNFTKDGNYTVHALINTSTTVTGKKATIIVNNLAPNVTEIRFNGNISETVTAGSYVNVSVNVTDYNGFGDITKVTVNLSVFGAGAAESLNKIYNDTTWAVWNKSILVKVNTTAKVNATATDDNGANHTNTSLGNLTVSPGEDVKLLVVPDSPKTGNRIQKATIRVYAIDQYENKVYNPRNIKNGELGVTFNSTTVTIEESITGNGSRDAPFTFEILNSAPEEAVLITASDIGTTNNTLADGTGVQIFIVATMSINVTPANSSIVANNSDNVTVYAQLIGTNEKPLAKVTNVSWSLTSTQISPMNNSVALIIDRDDKTNESGVAKATVQGGTLNITGTIKINAFADGKKGSADINLIKGPPKNETSTIKAYNATGADISGKNATVGSKVTIAALLKDEVSRILSGETVTFSIDISPDGASISPQVVPSDANGYANTTLTLSNKRGNNIVRVKSSKGDLNKTVSVWGDAANATIKAFNATGADISYKNATVSTEVNISARLLDPINGTPINGTSVTFTVESPDGNASLSENVVSTMNGYANTTLTLSPKSGNNTVRALSTRYDVNVSVSIWGDAAKVTLRALNATGFEITNATVGTNVILSARLLDPINDTPINDTNVTFKVIEGNGSLSSKEKLVSTINGYANTSFTLDTKTGNNTVRVLSEKYDVNTTVSVWGDPGNATKLNVTANPKVITTNANSTIIAQLMDQYDNPTNLNATGVKVSISPVNVSFTADTTEFGTLSASYNLTNSTGSAKVNFTASGAEGATTITASAPSLLEGSTQVSTTPPVDLELTAKPPSIQTKTNETIPTPYSNTTIEAQLLGRAGLPLNLAGINITFTTTNGTLGDTLLPSPANRTKTRVTDSSGVAKMNLTASVTIEEVTVTAVVTERGMNIPFRSIKVKFTGPASKIAIFASPSRLLTYNTSVITVQLRDSSDNEVSQPPTTINFGTSAGTLTNLSVTTENGRASTNLTSTKAGDLTVLAISTDYGTNQTTVTFLNRTMNVSATPNIINVSELTKVTVNVTSEGIPVDGARVTLSGAGVSMTNTTVNGTATFSVNATTSGTINVIATKDGYETATTTIEVKAIDTIPPSVTNPNATPNSIPDDTDNDPRWGETSQLNVTVTDESGIASVTINLSAIGFSATQTMTNLSNNIWSVTTNASNGTPPGTYCLPVNATDIYGNSNTSVCINLTVIKNGDVNEDGVVDLDDAIHLAKYVYGFPVVLKEEVADVDGDGTVTLDDAIYLAKHVYGFPEAKILH